MPKDQLAFNRLKILRHSQAELSVRAAKKKGEAVLIAERLVSGSGWLPVPVRIAEEAAAETIDDETGEETGCADDEAEFSQAAE